MQYLYLKLFHVKNVYISLTRNYAIIDEMLKLKTTNLNARIDVKVKSVKDKLLYSDYIESKSLKLGYTRNELITKRLESKFQKEREYANDKTSFSIIALKYFLKNKNCNLDKKNKLEQEQKIKQPIHMPYADIDKYENLSIAKSFEYINKESISVINKKYKILYEKYLNASKYSTTNPNNTSIDYKLKIRLDDDFSNVSSNWMNDYEIYDDKVESGFENVKYGTPDISTEVSSVPCGGCGALLHCKDVALPGYLPSEIFVNKSNIDLQSIICQRCHFMKCYNTCLDVRVSTNEYPKLLELIKKNKKALVILIVDLTDFPCSIWPEISSLIGENRHVFVVGNKVDLLPQDSPTFLAHVKCCLTESLIETGVVKTNIKHIALISAKTGYGVEELINKLHSIWQYRSDVYLVGCTNVGKSTLFNILLQSDFCKSQAVDLVQRATTSEWPGTTLSMLKFPILKPNPWRLFMRVQRLTLEQKDNHTDTYNRIKKFKNTRNIELMTLQNRINHTFKRDHDLSKAFARSQNSDIIHINDAKKFGLDETLFDYKISRWCYDTPGTIQPDQILHLLTTNELLNTLPNKIISPRTFCLWSGDTIFIAGLGRLDILHVSNFIRCTVFTSNKLPITICKVENAELVYNELLLSEAFVVPINNSDRLRMWPKLKSKDLKTVGIGQFESVSDIVLSNAGWIAITANIDDTVVMRAWTPEGRGIYLRTPALLPKSVTLRGMRKVGSRAYRLGNQVYFSRKF